MEHRCDMAKLMPEPEDTRAMSDRPMLPSEMLEKEMAYNNQPPWSSTTYDIRVSPVTNGYMVNVGCVSFVVERKDVLMEAISDYLDNMGEIVGMYQMAQRQNTERAAVKKVANLVVAALDGARERTRANDRDVREYESLKQFHRDVSVLFHDDIVPKIVKAELALQLSMHKQRMHSK